MARPLRIEYAGAFYHVTSRGNEAPRSKLRENKWVGSPQGQPTFLTASPEIIFG